MTEAGQSPEQMLAELEQRLAQARGGLESGQGIDMEGFQEDVKALCLAIQELPPEQMLAFEAPLQNLMDGLMGLAETLETKRDELEVQIKGMNQQKTAHSAYKKADDLGDDDSPEEEPKE